MVPTPTDIFSADRFSCAIVRTSGFLVEIRSGDPNMTVLNEKMEEYITNGCRLGWLMYIPLTVF